jgi:hypothetical protein
MSVLRCAVGLPNGGEYRDPRLLVELACRAESSGWDGVFVWDHIAYRDSTSEKARAVKARYVGVCRGCGADTQPRNGKGDASAYCKACHPGAIERRWTAERVLEAMLV